MGLWRIYAWLKSRAIAPANSSNSPLGLSGPLPLGLDIGALVWILRRILRSFPHLPDAVPLAYRLRPLRLPRRGIPGADRRTGTDSFRRSFRSALAGGQECYRQRDRLPAFHRRSRRAAGRPKPAGRPYDRRFACAASRPPFERSGLAALY